MIYSEKDVVSLAAFADGARNWLLEVAAPLWSHTGWHHKGLFAERLSLTGEADSCPRRVFVQARQVYSYCQIGKLGWDGEWRTKAEASVDYLLAHARREDGFFVHSLTKDGEPDDVRADLYDQAFMMFCCAHAGTILQRTDLFEVAESVANTLEQSWRKPAGGFWEGEIVPPHTRLQNPHMHLLEAFSALSSATGLPRWRTLAEEMAKLCLDRFIDPNTGALLEYFDAELTPLAGERGRVVEPGHCSEWAWLFEGLAERGWPGGAAISDRLVTFARSHGIDKTRGVMVNEILTDGSIRDGRARLWPQTERLKAALARFRRTRAVEEVTEAANAFAGLQKYLAVPVPGTWRDKLNPDNSWTPEPAPASSLYHITCSFVELIDTVNTTLVNISDKP